MPRSPWNQAIAVLGLHAVVGCSGMEGEAAKRREAIVYGDDDRREYFQVDDARLRAAFAESSVALVPRSLVDRERGALVEPAPTLAAQVDLCPGEAFAEQPSVAFCSGVLVDWDLVLTAGHCTELLNLESMLAVTGYFFTAPNELHLAAGDFLDVAEVVAVHHDPRGSEPRLDFAWLRLAQSAGPPRQPALVATDSGGAELDDLLLVISALGGTPAKLDAGARVREARSATKDYFLADADTSHGSSGAGAFDSELRLTGVLARGGADFVTTEAGCQIHNHVATDAAREAFTRIRPALDTLCQDPGRSSLCRGDCGPACRAAPRNYALSGGCSLGAHDRARAGWLGACAALLALRLARSRLRRPPELARPNEFARYASRDV